MTPEQVLQITQIAFVIILFIPSLITIAVLIVAAWKFLPVMVRQVQQLIDNNAQLAKIAKQNADQIATTEKTLANITPELVKQTQAIEAGNALILTQGIDFRSYQTLVSDSMSHTTTQVELNTLEIKTQNLKLIALEVALVALPSQIVEAIQDKFTCEAILGEFQTLRNEVTRAMFQQQRATGTFPVVPSTPTPTPQTQGGTGA